MRAQLKRTLLSTLALGALAVGSVPATADDTAAEIRLLRAQLRRLEQKVADQDRQNRRTQAAVARVSVAGGGPILKGPPPLIASCGPSAISFKEICITPGGFLAGETRWSDKAVGGTISSSYQNIPFNNSRLSHVGETRFSAAQSRFSLLAQGKFNATTLLTGYGEVDFLGAGQTANFNESSSFNLRIRHLYAAVDKTDWGFHFLAGQTWSLVTMNGVGIIPRKENIPLTIDPQYVPGFVWARQAQLRAVQDFGKFSVGLSAESSATTGVSGLAPPVVNGLSTFTAVNGNCGGFIAGAGTPSSVSPGPTGGFNNINACNTLSLNQLPDFVGKVTFDPEVYGRAVHIEGWGLLRDFYDRTGTANAAIPQANGTTTAGFTGNSNHDVFGGGAGGSVLVSMFPKVLELQFSGAYGNGLGRYGTSQLPDVTYSARGTLKPIQEFALLAGAVLHVNSFDVYAYAGQEQQLSAIYRNGTSLAGVGNGLTSSNLGCDIEGSTNCTSMTKKVRQATIGFWNNIYKGEYGKVMAGAQYQFSQRFGYADANGVKARQDVNTVLTSFRYYPF